MSELSVGSLSGLAANSYVIDVASGSSLDLSNATDLPAAALPAGSILQVVNATTSTRITSSTNTFVDTTVTANITPSSASSKILISVVSNGVNKFTSNTYAKFRLLRDASVIASYESAAGSTSTTATNGVGSVHFEYLDSPATTSEITYKTQFNSGANSASAQVHATGSMGSIVLMEVAG